jgi:ribosomal-protein-alanine N-acetyltransferase
MGDQLRLECSKSVVRDWSPADKADLVRYANNRNVWRNLARISRPYTDADADAWLATLAVMSEPSHWAIEVEGHAVGSIGVYVGDGISCKTGDFGYWLGEPFWGRGIMSEAATAVARYAMERFGLCRLQARVFAWNPASMRVLEHAGFTIEGVSRASVFKDGELIDGVNYALVDPGYR